MLIDNHGRPINYLRLAVTDRCNLRCFYCMPEEGIQYLPKPHLLSYEEMIRLVSILAEMGISKVRITGGEPFLRRDIMPFLWKLSEIEGINKINITTNGVLTAPLVPELKKLGVSSVNLSLDSLDRQRFYEITRRDEFPKVWETLETLLTHDIPVKINTVVMSGKNDEDILSMVELARDQNVSVRFIEEMPFNGAGLRPDQIQNFWSYGRIMDLIRSVYPEIYRLQDEPNSTSYNYQIPNFKGSIGVIAAFSRTFCGTCNRVRVTPTGVFKTCLYDDGVFNIRDMMRQKLSDEQIKLLISEALQSRALNGFEAEKNRKNLVSESMTTIGG
ncbi:GTP 3',8-cyclase MoaA [Emticicia sp. C21]|uniref:GTP 3',8-cyclase MoaA n=1 Tax=Emticicia sp. C21 TaxID=2302915 RepID=UPI000E35743F|nr:GTP 3',8-cyclase MoaA [Emticicia sp. C21]RFS15855.1 GTP 3',8-cyclase MoaA [Emticicia sp. C21]